MKRLTTLAFLLGLNFLFAQDCKQDLIPKQGDNRMWGYVNLMEDWVVLPQYHKVQPFRGKAALVQKGKKFGAINCNGRSVIPCDYELIKPFIANKAWVQKQGKWGLYTDDGRMLLTPQYDEVQAIASYRDQVWVRKNEVWGLFDLDKERFLYNPQFSEFLTLKDVALVKKGDKSGMISTIESRNIYPFVIEHAKGLPKNRIGVKVDQKWGLISEEGQTIIKPLYDTLQYFGYSDFKVKNTSGEMLFDLNGKQLNLVPYDTIFPFKGGRARVSKNGKYGFISVLGREIIELQYKSASDYNNGVTVVQTERGYGLLNKRNNWTIPDTFDLIVPTNDSKHLIAKRGGTYYTIYDNVLNEMPLNGVYRSVYKDRLIITLPSMSKAVLYAPTFNVFTKEYDDIKYLGNELYLVELEGKFGVIDLNGKQCLKIKYDNISLLSLESDVLLSTKIGNVVQLYNSSGVLWIKKDFSSANVYKDHKTLIGETPEGKVFLRSKKVISNPFSDFLLSEPNWPVIIKQNKKEVLVSYSGKELEKTRYDEIKHLSKNFYAYRKKKKWGVIDSKGKVLLEAKYNNVLKKTRRGYLVTIKKKEVEIDHFGR